ncbi:DUF4394 domain-containing protein [Hymenobacter sp. H14-R3]|uniref:DUF4394 domain-containing protein n=1 Tax=Hymenobacter sp. H14-R3 TaxID=3046308 RepID=UPI0024B8813A|nr:DUF4394 domain-containing protein [Hymenobacter sp. H14-R3]MDJ0367680.1 DUF4394 domain-containing protein [Hymenobacter sp. H14-R3]
MNGVTGAAISAVAYTNPVSGGSATVLYDIDPTTGKLYRQDPPNVGTLVAVGALGVNTTGVNWFDIGGASGTGFAVLTVGTTASVYTINLAIGAATIRSRPAAPLAGNVRGLRLLGPKPPRAATRPAAPARVPGCAAARGP